MRRRGPQARVWAGYLAAFFACGAVTPPANSADMPSAPPLAVEQPPAGLPAVPNATSNPGDSFEVRFGPSIHAEGSDKAHAYVFDLAASFLTPRLDLGLSGYWAYLTPRLQVGGSLNLEGRTSYAYLDSALTLPVTSWLFVEPFFGGAVHNGSLVSTWTLNGLGCPLLFHLGVGLGVPINQHWSVLGTFEHLSNGKTALNVDCGTNAPASGSNQGLNVVGVRAGYSF